MVKKQIWIVYWILAALSVVDFLITKTILTFESGMEANPSMAYIIAQFGINGILFVKLFWLILLAGGILAIADRRYKILFWAIAIIDVLMLVNLIWSDKILFQVFYS
jgi:hypothetical protein